MRYLLIGLLLACSSASERQATPAETPAAPSEPEPTPSAEPEAAEAEATNEGTPAAAELGGEDSTDEGSEGEEAEAVPVLCGADAPEGLLAAAREAQPNTFAGEVVAPLELYAALFDANEPGERVVRARIATTSENPMEPARHTDHLIAFECNAGEWQMVASRAFDATPEEDDECRRGVSRIDMQRIDGIDQLIVTSHECQLRVDPKFTRETLTILALRGRAFVSVFDCDFAHDATSGPCRSGVRVSRQIQPYDTEKVVRVRTTRTFNRGTCDEDGELGGPAEASGEYRWNGQQFAATGDDVCR